jgi:hypothetical protein
MAWNLMVLLGFKHVGPGQKFHHTLHLRVPADIGLCAGDGGIRPSPSHPVAHEIDGPLQYILTAVKEFLGLLSKRK